MEEKFVAKWLLVSHPTDGSAVLATDPEYGTHLATLPVEAFFEDIPEEMFERVLGLVSGLNKSIPAEVTIRFEAEE